MKQSLEDKIRELPAPSLSEARKESIKNAVFANIRMAKDVRTAVVETELSLHSKLMVLARLRDYVESKKNRFSFISWPTFRRQFAAGLLVMVLLMGGFSFVNVNTSVVFAAEFTQLVDVNGEVIVEREGKQINGYKGMELYERDRVLTGEAALAVVKFFDDSISRLSSSTSVEIEKLANSDLDLSSYVRIEIENGQVWSKVVSLVAENSAFVVTGNGISAQAQKGAFNVRVNNENVELGVFSNEVSVTGEKFKEKVKVVTGQKLVTNKRQNTLPLVVTLPPAEKSNQWAKTNLADDRAYVVEVENRLIAAKMKSVGLEIDESVSLESSARENTLKFLTFSDVDKEKLNLDLAEKRFVAAQIKLLEKNLSETERLEAEQAIRDFYFAVKSFYSFADSVATTDSDYASELRKYAHDKVLKQKKTLSTTLPDSPYYFAKDVIAQIEVIGADGVELAKIKQDQAQDKLVTVEEVVGKGDLDLATKVLEDYQQDISDVITILDKDTEVESVDKNEIIQSVKDSSLVLQAIDKASTTVLTEKPALEADVVVDTVEDKTLEDKDEEPSLVPESGDGEKSEVETKTEEESKILDSKMNFNFQIKQNLDFSNLIIDGPFGVTIQGDKPLDPLL